MSHNYDAFTLFACYLIIVSKIAALFFHGPFNSGCESVQRVVAASYFEGILLQRPDGNRKGTQGGTSTDQQPNRNST